MSGRTITLFTMREFDFSKVTGGQSQEIPIIKALDVSGMTEGTLLVRVHSRDWSDSGAESSVDVIAYTTAPSAEDPSQDFVAAAASATATVDGVDTSSTDPDPMLETAALSANFGDRLKITVKGTQSSAGLATFLVTLSAELVLKD